MAFIQVPEFHISYHVLCIENHLEKVTIYPSHFLIRHLAMTHI